MSKPNKSIRVVSSNRYVIEVNDNGDTISLDLSDLNLMNNLSGTFKKLDDISNNFKKEMKTVDAMNTEDMEDEYLTKKEVKQMEKLNKFFSDSRLVLDEFLGEGACQKIFGDHNFVSMFDDLSKALDPCFKEMRKKFDEYQKQKRREIAETKRKGKKNVLS